MVYIWDLVDQRVVSLITPPHFYPMIPSLHSLCHGGTCKASWMTQCQECRSIQSGVFRGESPMSTLPLGESPMSTLPLP
jgi:hypothetical protein